MSHNTGHAHTDSPHHYRPLSCCTGKLWHSLVFQRIINTSDDISNIGLQHVQYKCMSFGIVATNFFSMHTYI